LQFRSLSPSSVASGRLVLYEPLDQESSEWNNARKINVYTLAEGQRLTDVRFSSRIIYLVIRFGADLRPFSITGILGICVEFDRPNITRFALNCGGHLQWRDVVLVLGAGTNTTSSTSTALILIEGETSGINTNYGPRPHNPKSLNITITGRRQRNLYFAHLGSKPDNWFMHSFVEIIYVNRTTDVTNLFAYTADVPNLVFFPTFDLSYLSGSCNYPRRLSCWRIYCWNTPFHSSFGGCKAVSRSSTVGQPRIIIRNPRNGITQGRLTYIHWSALRLLSRAPKHNTNNIYFRTVQILFPI
ncbi:hypothetical protein L9F63_008487, partial [Diploptera punctata]